MPVGKVDRKSVTEQVEQDEAARTRTGNSFYEPQQGDNAIRIVPPPPGVDYVFYKTATHWGVGPSKAVLNCPRAQDDNAYCFLCDKSFQLSNKNNDEATQALGNKLRARRQWLYNIIDLDAEEPTLKVASFGLTIHEKIATYLKADRADEYGDITDLDEGRNLIINRKGTGMNTKYDVQARMKATPAPEEIIALLETEDPTELSTVRPPASNEKMKALFEGTAVDDDDEAEDEAPVEAPVASVRRAARAVVEPVEDDDATEDAPASRIASRIRSRASR